MDWFLTPQAEMARRHAERLRPVGQREDAALRRPGRKVTAAPVEAVVAAGLGIDPHGFRRQRQGGWERALLAKERVEQAGLTQREAARVRGLTTGAAVSMQLRRLHAALSQEAQLGRQVKPIEARLNHLLFKG